ncbi:Flp family type IVb pilin [Caldalkalibacillus salinus]|uniref:Flp family type IVb pilin n=1 Tax=Caldalkalibacillus salinus TaxID=2803787 RepID=UPI001922E40A|nr:Flp family type IVb pilin [Caldalkalibacillus salinus]
MKKKLTGLIHEEEGQGMTEYGLVLGVIAVSVLVIIATLREEIVKLYKEAVTNIQSRGSTSS